MRAVVMSAVLAAGPVLAEQPDWAAKFRRDLGQCWNVAALVGGAAPVSVTVAFDMGQDGRPVTESITLVAHGAADEAAAQQSYEAARRAILRCGRDGYDLPRDAYVQWQRIQMTFDPDTMERL